MKLCLESRRGFQRAGWTIDSFVASSFESGTLNRKCFVHHGATPGNELEVRHAAATWRLTSGSRHRT